MHGLSLVVVSWDFSLIAVRRLSLQWLLLWGMGSRDTGSVVVAHRPGCPAACGIYPD